MTEKTRTLLAVLLVTALLLAACGGGTGAPAPEAATSAPVDSSQPAEPAATEALVAPAEPTSGGQVRIGWGGSPDTLNPGAAVLAEAYTLFELAYSAMFDLNLDGISPTESQPL